MPRRRRAKRLDGLMPMPELLDRPQYGTSMHWPDCLGGGCTGCLPPIDIPARPCAPAIGVHRSGCDCPDTLRVSDIGPVT